jgi:hypothetical protein
MRRQKGLKRRKVPMRKGTGTATASRTSSSSAAAAAAAAGDALTSHVPRPSVHQELTTTTDVAFPHDRLVGIFSRHLPRAPARRTYHVQDPTSQSRPGVSARVAPSSADAAPPSEEAIAVLVAVNSLVAGEVPPLMKKARAVREVWERAVPVHQSRAVVDATTPSASASSLPQLAQEAAIRAVQLCTAYLHLVWAAMSYHLESLQRVPDVAMEAALLRLVADASTFSRALDEASRLLHPLSPPLGLLPTLLVGWRDGWAKSQRPVDTRLELAVSAHPAPVDTTTTATTTTNERKARSGGSSDPADDGLGDWRRDGDDAVLDAAASEARSELLAMLGDPSLGATLSMEAREGGGPLSEVASAHLAVLRRKGVCARIVAAFDGFHLRKPPRRVRTGRAGAAAAAAEADADDRATGANQVVASALAQALARASDSSKLGDGFDDDDDIWDDDDDETDPKRKAGYEARAPELSDSSGDESTD